jgi:hypothetical protein
MNRQPINPPVRPVTVPPRAPVAPLPITPLPPPAGSPDLSRIPSAPCSSVVRPLRSR